MPEHHEYAPSRTREQGLPLSTHSLTERRSLPELFRYFLLILAPERSYYWLAAVYGLGIGLLSLATPISVQLLINTVAHTGLTTPLVVLSLCLFGLLLLAGLLNALRIHILDLFGRRFYARMVAEIALRAVYAVNPFFDDNKKGALFNRYFDIVVVIKMMPNLLIGAFTILLQALVGFVLVSLYHPFFLVFNLTVVLLLWLTWVIWGRRAIKSALELSHSKHAAAAWLQGLASSNGFFKSEQHIDDALMKTDAVTRDYLDHHVTHFRHHFGQTIALLFIYAAASATLLGLGGWLVIQGQLSLGQLVAAELVLSVVFYGLSQFGVYLTYFYDLCAAIEELSLFDDVEQEELSAGEETLDADGGLVFTRARGVTRGVAASLDFELPAGRRILARADLHGVQRLFTTFLKGHEQPTAGLIALGGRDIRSVALHTLRQQVIVLDRPNIIESTIREYLSFSGTSAGSAQIIEALRIVGLEPVITEFEDGLDTQLAATGWPLSITETMQLKLAAAMIARPRVLVLNQLHDSMSETHLRACFDALQRDARCTVLLFSNRIPDLGFDGWLRLGTTRQELFDSAEAFVASAPADRPASGDRSAAGHLAPGQPAPGQPVEGTLSRG